MADDLTNIRLTSEANAVADKLVETGRFENVATVAKFALAYALKNHFDEIDPIFYPITDGGGSNYNVGSFDSDGRLRDLLRALYPGATTPYFYARALMMFGLKKIDERLQREGFNSVHTLLE